ncbi:MAG: tyrosine-type recombinase/integrase [Planctomycetota bacterium]|nr:tyrosine-type recombinase/integrase [Planctomycetota bacterium]
MRPVPIPGGQGFKVTFRHPACGNKPKTYGLGTRELAAAEAICLDAESLLSHLRDKNQLDDGMLRTFRRRAVEIILGDDIASRAFGSAPSASLGREGANEVMGEIEKARLLTKKDREAGIDHNAEDEDEFVTESLEKLSPRSHRLLLERTKDLEAKLATARETADAFQHDALEYRKMTNVTVRVSLGAAIRGSNPKPWLNQSPAGFEAHHAASGVSDQEHRQCGATLRMFMDALGEGMKLGTIRAKDIDVFLRDMKALDGKPLNVRTKRNRRGYLALFFRWAAKEYGLGRNPMADIDEIKGVVHEDIRAIGTEEDLRHFISALAPVPYWQAWAAFACLAGPRYSEQCRLTVDDVLLDQGYCVIKARKTGRQRRVPLERSILLPILREHVRRRLAEMADASGLDNLRTRLLFPSIVGAGTIKRTKSAPGTWSSNRNWRDNWDAATKATGTWDHGPAEWRHSFGTALGMCGWNALEISRVMGNSPAVCERHYVAAVSLGPTRRWKLEF